MVKHQPSLYNGVEDEIFLSDSFLGLILSLSPKVCKEDGNKTELSGCKEHLHDVHFQGCLLGLSKKAQEAKPEKHGILQKSQNKGWEVLLEVPVAF